MVIAKAKKPAAIVMDLTGTLATKAFMTNSKEGKAFLLANVRQYVVANWGHKELRVDINFLRLQQDKQIQNLKDIQSQADAEDDTNTVAVSNTCNATASGPWPPLITCKKSPSSEQTDSVVNNIIWRLDNEDASDSPATALFHLHLFEWAYRKGLLTTP